MTSTTLSTSSTCVGGGSSPDRRGTGLALRCSPSARVLSVNLAQKLRVRFGRSRAHAVARLEVKHGFVEKDRGRRLPALDPADRSSPDFRRRRAASARSFPPRGARSRGRSRPAPRRSILERRAVENFRSAPLRNSLCRSSPPRRTRAGPTMQRSPIGERKLQGASAAGFEDGVFHHDRIGPNRHRRAFGHDNRTVQNGATRTDRHVACDRSARRHVRARVDLRLLAHCSKRS